MKVVESFILTDKYDLSKEKIKEYAFDSARRRHELYGDFEVDDVDVELINDTDIKTYLVKVLQR